ncbi:MAG: homoserine O-acetyltransferase, partial [Bacteroidetes bacterium]
MLPLPARLNWWRRNMGYEIATQEFAKTETINLVTEDEPMLLECGALLPQVDVAYETYGELNDERTNAVLICHALSANAHAAGLDSESETTRGWWDGLLGPGKAFDTDKYFVVCSNILGSCYGTTGPASINPATGKQYRASFPRVTVRDMVTLQKRLLDSLGVERLAAVCGSSLGGMQVLEWGVMYPEFCETIIPISVAAKQTAWCIGLNAAARAAITGDPQWNNGNYDEQPANGLSLARMIGMISYRSAEEFAQRFGRNLQYELSRFDERNVFQIESYLRHQGEKLVRRFDANTYLTLSYAMDLHDVTYGRGTLRDALGSVSARALCIGVSSDLR